LCRKEGLITVTYIGLLSRCDGRLTAPDEGSNPKLCEPWGSARIETSENSLFS
jgi:hypothetical protein